MAKPSWFLCKSVGDCKKHTSKHNARAKSCMYSSIFEMFVSDSWLISWNLTKTRLPPSLPYPVLCSDRFVDSVPRPPQGMACFDAPFWLSWDTSLYRMKNVSFVMASSRISKGCRWVHCAYEDRSSQHSSLTDFHGQSYIIVSTDPLNKNLRKLPMRVTQTPPSTVKLNGSIGKSNRQKRRQACFLCHRTSRPRPQTIPNADPWEKCCWTFLTRQCYSLR